MWYFSNLVVLPFWFESCLSTCKNDLSTVRHFETSAGDYGGLKNYMYIFHLISEVATES